AITAKAEEEGFDVILQTSHNPAEDLQKCESKIKQKMIKGIIMLSSPADESFFAQLDKYDIPVVVIGKVEGQYAHVYSVDTDNFGDSIALTDALIESGHQNIACLHAPLDVHVSVDRVNGYKQSLAAHNIAVRDEWIVDGGYTHETALKAARQLLSQSPLPEAVFATDSLKLMSIYRAAAEKNIAIPQQLAVVGYSNETLSFILTPAPGGIDVPTQELGQQSCELLFRLISGKPSPQNITVATHMTLK
ncbi:substrate-binding domain-containing protein, partial [Escherichia coli]